MYNQLNPTTVYLFKFDTYLNNSTNTHVAQQNLLQYELDV